MRRAQRRLAAGGPSPRRHVHRAESPAMRRLFLFAISTAIVITSITLLAQNTTPHTINVAGPLSASLGVTTFINKGLVGVGRLSASQLDPFGETFGSASGLQITNWTVNGDGTYSGIFHLLPDRGYNLAGTPGNSFFADYAGRINSIGFRFTPYTGSAPIGGGTDAEKIAAQNQIVFTTP